MRYRTATIEDLDRLLKLYQAVARTEGGLARLEHEVTPEYIGKFLEKSLAAGLIIVGENPEPRCRDAGPIFVDTGSWKIVRSPVGNSGEGASR